MFEHRAVHLRLKIAQAEKELEGKIAERSQFEAEQWKKILLRWPQIRDIEANFNICQIACRPLDVTLDGIALLLEDESFVRQLSIGDVETVKAELIDKIASHLDEMTDAEGVVKHRRKLMAFWTLEKLRQELSRIESVHNLQGKSTTELRQIVRQGRSVTGYPALPTTIVRPGTIKPVPLDAAYIKRVDRDSLKKLIRIYSADAVNARLRGE